MKDLMRKIITVTDGEGERVTAVSVWLGALSHMSPAHFKEHYDDASTGTIAEGAELQIEASDDTDHDHAQSILLKEVQVSVYPS